MISGYKPFELGIFNQKHEGIVIIKQAIENKLRVLLDEGLESIFISGQLGVECWAAEVVFELKKEYPNIKLGVVTPFLEQESSWNETNKEYYYSIINRADRVISTSNETYKNPSQFKIKDEALLNYTEGLILVYDEEKEGSPKYLKSKANKHREKNNYQLFEITMYDLEDIAREIEENKRGFWEE